MGMSTASRITIKIYNSDPYYVLLAIASHATTDFVVQGQHNYYIK